MTRRKTKSDTDVTVLMAVLEATFANQESLRILLDKLASENRPLKDDDERGDFMRMLTYSTLGLGKDYPAIFNLPGGGITKLSNIEVVARFLAYEPGPMVTFNQFGSDMNCHVSMPIGHCWGELRKQVLRLFPLAVDRSISVSKERDIDTGSKGFRISR